jgi:hypothetical protein
MLLYYSFEGKTIKWWKKLFSHLFNLAVVNAHILHTKTSNKNILLHIFYKKVAKGLLASAGMEIQIKGQTSSQAGRLVGRDHFLYRIPATHAKLEGKSWCSCCVCADRSMHHT